MALEANNISCIRGHHKLFTGLNFSLSSGQVLLVEGNNASVRREQSSLTVLFDLTDNNEVVTVSYTGILPDLFREGQGIIARGRLNENGVVNAVEVLAKHDENYMPPEVSEALEKSEGREQ